MGDVPAILFLHHAEKLELCLDHYAHTDAPEGKFLLRLDSIFIIDALSTICDAEGCDE